MAAPTKITMLWQNVAPSSSAYSGYPTASFDSNYPVSNCYGNDIHVVGRTETNVNGFKYWRIDTGGSINYDTIAVAGCNLTYSNPSSSYLSVGSSNATATPTGYTYNTQFYFNTVTKCGIYYWSSTQTNRYIAIRMTDANLDFYEMGIIWIGMKLQLHRNPQIPIDLIRTVETTDLVTGGGQVWSYQNYKKRGYGLTFVEDFDPSGSGSFASLDNMYYNLGNSLPFFFHLLPGDTNDPPMFVHTTSFDFKIDGKDKRPGRWIIEEEI